MANKPVSINLVRREGKSFFDNFLSWSLTAGRFIVILTETVALLAFLYRFNLDRQLIDLHDNIARKQIIVKLLSDDEKKFRDIQDRLTLSSKISTGGNRMITVFNDIANFAPAGFSINSFSLNDNRIHIDGTVRSALILKAFISSLRNYPSISSVSLDQIENRTSNAIISVSITATM